MLSGRTETPEGGVVVRSCAKFSSGSAFGPEVARGGKTSFSLAYGCPGSGRSLVPSKQGEPIYVTPTTACLQVAKWPRYSARVETWTYLQMSRYWRWRSVGKWLWTGLILRGSNGLSELGSRGMVQSPFRDPAAVKWCGNWPAR